MNCETSRRALLGCERPSQPPAPVRQHLDGCRACAAWQRRLAELEARLRRLPVPPSSGPGPMLQRLFDFPAPAARAPRPAPVWGGREGGRQKVALAFALAAALAVFAVGWWAWPHQRGARPVTPAAQRWERRLGEAVAKDTPAARAVAVARLADEVLDEAQQHADDPGRVEPLARFYARLVREELVAQARDVPAGERAGVLGPLAGRLGRRESDVARRAGELEQRGSASSASFRGMARAARDGERRLRALTPA